MISRISVAVLLCGAACKQERPNVAATPAPTPAPTAPAAPKGGQLSERLEQEAAARPAASLKAEETYSKLVAAGAFEIKERMQVLGAPVGAAYCQNAHTANDVVVTLCEFESDAAAEAGKAKAVSAIEVANRQVVAHHATTLQITESPKSEASTKAAAAAIAAFNAL